LSLNFPTKVRQRSSWALFALQLWAATNIGLSGEISNDLSHMHPFHFSESSLPLFSVRPLGSLAMLLTAAGVINAAQPAEARQSTYYDSFYQGWFQSPFRTYHPRRHERAPERRPVERSQPAEPKAADGKKPAGLLYAVVSLADQHVSFYDANGLWERSVISTGVAGHPTPPGIFTILEKERWHRSNIYSGAPMPYMQRLAWTGVAMHERVVTGRPASHGCIRLPGDLRGSFLASQAWESAWSSRRRMSFRRTS